MILCSNLGQAICKLRDGLSRVTAVDKGKPAERQGRKVSGLKGQTGLTIAGPPAVRVAPIAAPLIKCAIARMKGETSLKEQMASAPVTVEAQVREFIDAAWPRNPLDEPGVKFWRIAGRTTLLVLLASSASSITSLTST